ncbi:hypothetical protein D3C87_1381840 [compost metagenome]
MRSAGADAFGADHIADFVTFQNDPLQLTFGRRNELNIQMSGKLLQQLFIGQVDTMVMRSKCQQAVQRTGIQQVPAQTLGQNSGYGAFARAAWPINGDDRCNVFHD